MRVLVIIPAYNEGTNIIQTIRSLTKVSSFDYLVVNDCSTDDTERLLSEHQISHLNLPVNLGIGGAVQAGYKYALENEYDIAIQMDGDGQHKPEYISQLIEPITAKQADIVIGSRFIEHEGFQSSAVRRIGINFLSGLIKLMSRVDVSDVTSGFRAVNKKGICLYSNVYAQDYPEPEAIVTAAKNRLRIQEIPVQMQERVNGKSSINGLKSAYYMIKVSIAIIIAVLSDGRK